ncbi:MAG: cytochrome c [Burkholderiaceae bacterium]|nr:cytochrome c [Burkholderiaceae bacterium]MEB2349894.1 cytochrome c [Burkholderiaceae bacterium]
MNDLYALRSARYGALAGTLALALFAVSGAQAADIARGKEKADQVCAACHGKDGNTPIDPSYPRLAGQHADYLRHALHAYQADQRKNPIMGAQAKQLSRADIENLASWYASLPGPLSHQR